MTYFELVELYKKGELSSEQKQKLERDIERHEAISEYLFDRDEADISDLKLDESFNNSEADTDESAKFAKMIKSSIRKSFIKAGVVVGLVVLIVVCSIIYVVPKFIDSQYYNPAQIIASDEVETNRMSLDLATYSELFLPENYRTSVDVIGNGSANYDIVIRQTFSYTDSFTNVGGKIDKGRMILYNPNILVPPFANSFVPSQNVVQTGCHQNYKEDLNDKLNELNDDTTYTAYLTLNKVMSYDEFSKWEDASSLGAVWCALCEKTSDDDNTVALYKADRLIGFGYSNSSSYLGFDEEKYPMLTQFSLAETTGESENWKISEKNMRQHIVSMLRFMSEQDRFCEMVGFDDYKNLSELAKIVENEGIYIYGFVSVGGKDDISKIVDTGMIEHMYVKETE